MSESQTARVIPPVRGSGQWRLRYPPDFQPEGRPHPSAGRAEVASYSNGDAGEALWKQCVAWAKRWNLRLVRHDSHWRRVDMVDYRK